ncbi:MAG: PHP domain-containing protein [Bacteroidia bacterium]|nr:PHP domain-containing protein [Bacteroidia bacterium]
MTNDEIIDSIELYGKLLELHNENPFKVKAISNAAYKLNKLRFDFQGKSKEEIDKIEGIGKSIASFIQELIENNSAKELDVLLEKTPQGVIQMLTIKGLGPKKVSAIWHDLGVESPHELLYACNENRLASLKGFGEKTQQSVIANIEFMLANETKKHYASVEKPVLNVLEFLREKNPATKIEVVGEFRRKCEVLDKIEFLADKNLNVDLKNIESGIGLPIQISNCETTDFYYEYFRQTATPLHLEKLEFQKLQKKQYNSEQEIYKQLHLQYIEPELREGLNEIELAKRNELPVLIETNDLKGILHNHTTYSDGLNTLKEMADYCQKNGFEYLGICDHSQSAFYANGLKAERVIEQQEEIDKLNAQYKNFKILKGIESDILSDGSLDYPEEILKTFDFIVTSVHSNLKMTEEKATARLIKAIENKYTSILGHPTGRLLLARPGYPINHKKIIDACAANKVSIELNAHPYRLDIDWRWIYYCIEKNVKVSINPDAHHVEGLNDMYYGVCVARKGMLTKEMCLNALELNELLKEFKK